MAFSLVYALMLGLFATTNWVVNVLVALLIQYPNCVLTFTLTTYCVLFSSAVVHLHDVSMLTVSSLSNTLILSDALYTSHLY